MGKVCAVSLSLLILIQSFNISFEDIVQLDELIEHAQYHKVKHGDNLFVFISKHYGELKDDHHENHKEEDDHHQELPFQNCDHLVPISLFVFQNQHSDHYSFGDIEILELNFNYIPSCSKLHKTELLQPPRMA